MPSNSRMTAVVCHGPEDYRVEQVERPTAGARELVIRITACGICASDCKCWSGAEDVLGRRPLREGAGDPRPRVLRRGQRRRPGLGRAFRRAAWRARDRRADRSLRPLPVLPLGPVLDVRGAQHLRLPARGRRRRHGGIHAAAADRPRAQHPSAMPVDDAAIIEPLACAIHTVQRGDIQLSDVLVIAGAGPIGLMMVQVARLKTPKKLVVIDPVAERRDLALRFGADVVIDPAREPAGEIVRGLTDGYGCDVYIEATGSPIGVTQGLDLIRKLGRFVEFSVFGKDATVDWSIIGDRKELDVRGAHLGPYCYPIAIDLLERGLVTSRGIVTNEYRLEEWDTAIQVANSLDSIKVLLKPQAAEA